MTQDFDQVQRQNKLYQRIASVGYPAPSMIEMSFVDQLVGKEYTPLKQFKLHVSKDKNGNPILDKNGEKVMTGRFLQNESGRLAMVAIAIYNLYTHRHLKLFFDEQLTAYALPDNKDLLREPETYVKTNFERFKKDDVVDEIVRYVEWRWSTTKVNAQNVRTTISAYLMKKLRIDPFWTAVNLAVKKLIMSKRGWEPVTIPDFEKAFSAGIAKEDKEPYRDRVFEYLLKAPLVLHWQNTDGTPAYTGGGIQAMPILYGRQGLGKSTLVKKLGLGWSDNIKNVAKLDQENIYKRAMDVFLDFGELSGMKKSDLVDLKSALTQRFLTFNPKYSNGIKSLPANALIVGTTNETDLLKDLTGERRFWPVLINRYDYDQVNYRFILRAFATEYIVLQTQFESETQPTLNLIESEEDRSYKEDNYGQADSAINTVEDFIKDLLVKKEYENDLFYEHHDHYYRFATKSKVENGFISWQKDNDFYGKKVYPSKVTSYLLGLSGAENGKRFRINGKIVRGIIVPIKTLNKKLGLSE